MANSILQVNSLGNGQVFSNDIKPTNCEVLTELKINNSLKDSTNSAGLDNQVLTKSAGAFVWGSVPVTNYGALMLQINGGQNINAGASLDLAYTIGTNTAGADITLASPNITVNTTGTYFMMVHSAIDPTTPITTGQYRINISSGVPQLASSFYGASDLQNTSIFFGTINAATVLTIKAFRDVLQLIGNVNTASTIEPKVFMMRIS